MRQLSQQRVTSYVEARERAPASSRRSSGRARAARVRRTTSPKQIKASSALDSVLIDVAVTDPSPQRAADIANAVGRRLQPPRDELERPTPPGAQPPVAVRVVQPAAVPVEAVVHRTCRMLVLGLAAGLVARGWRGTGPQRARHVGEVARAAARRRRGAEPRHHRLRPAGPEAAADRARGSAVAPVRGLPAAADQPAVRRRRPAAQGHRRHQLACRARARRRRWPTWPSRWPRPATGYSSSRPTCAGRSSPTCSAWNE